jgi:TRAP-type C4-dicarboxylate transport system permease large subunit
MIGNGDPFVDGLFTAGSTVLALLTFIWYWAFRRGSPVVRQAINRDTGQFVKGCFAALPGGLMFVGGSLMGAADLLIDAPDTVAAAGAVFWVLMVVWVVKELRWPTLRRTPDWLRVELRRNAMLRDQLVGKRRQVR